MKQAATFQLVERLKSETVRLAAAGGESNNTPVFQLIEELEKGLRHLLVAAQWGVDAHSSAAGNLRRAEELLGVKYQ